MCVMKMMVGDTPTVVRYQITRKGIRIARVVALNHKIGNRWSGRRPISLDAETQENMAAVIANSLQEKAA